MPKFYARILSDEGVIRTHEIEASTIDLARHYADRKGQVITLKKKFNVDLSIGMRPSERHSFLLRLSAMLKSNMGLTHALQKIADTFGGRIKAAAAGMLTRLETGMGLDEAVTLDYKNFPPATAALIKAGVVGGNTQQALKSAVEFEQLLSQVAKGAYKHFFTAFLALAISFAIVYYTIYDFAPIILDSPMVKNNAAIDVTLAKVFSHVLLWVLGAKMAFMGGAILLATVVRRIIPNLADKLILKIPHYKDLVLSRNTYVTLYKLGLMTKNGLTLADTLRFAEFETPRGALKTDLRRARRFLDEGIPWANALESLHPTDRAALASATDSDDLATTLDALAEYYRDLYISKINSIGPAVEFMSALYLVAATVSLVMLTVIPSMQMTQTIVDS